MFLLLAGQLLVAGEDPCAVLDVITACGVRRIVLLSSQGARTRPEAISHSRLRAFERAVQQAGLEWTILRPGGFYSNAFAWAGPVRSRQAVAAPFADVGLPWIDPADIAEVAAAALRDGSHARRTYELTGPALISPRERAQVIGNALGTPVSFTEQSREEARAQMLQFMPEPVVDGTRDTGRAVSGRTAGKPRRRTGARPPAPHLHRMGSAQHRGLPVTRRLGPQPDLWSWRSTTAAS